MRPASLICALLLLPAVTFGVFGQHYTASAARFLQAVKDDNNNKALAEIRFLANGSDDLLASELDTESKAKAFWLNVYNAFVQYQLKRNPARFEDRDAFFGDRSITVAGQLLSLDDIEHGILRRSTHKYSFGYFASFFTSAFEKQFRLKEIDYRIHFALNCGAESCPPVALYEAGRVETQLSRATENYLKKFVRFDARRNLVAVPVLCFWYSGDFGGESGIIAMLQAYGLLAASEFPEVEYLPYDWTLHLSYYVSL